MMMAAMIAFALSLILYSTQFNNFLKGEYLLVMLYMVMSLSVMPIMQAALAVFSRPLGVPLKSRVLALPSIIVVLLMAVSVAVCGADMYRLWIIRGADGMAGDFYAGSWHYNLIVAVHYYLFWTVMVFEVVFVVIYIARCYVKFRGMLGEYYTSDYLGNVVPKGFYLLLGFSCLCLLLVYLVYPFNRPRPEWVVVLFCSVEVVCMFGIGRYVFNIEYGAERLGEKIMGGGRVGHGDLKQIGRAIAKLLEEDREYANPDISVFLLAERLHVSQDDIVDAVHNMSGSSFRDYIDGMRVENAIAIVNKHPEFRYDNPEHLTRIAHRCGYISLEAFENAFSRVTQMSIKQWFEGGGL